MEIEELFDTFSAHLHELERLIREIGTDAAEARARGICEELAGEDVAAKIAGIDMRELEADTAGALAQAMRQAREHGCEAVYVEWDMHNDWDFAWFACPAYDPEDDDWACDHRWGAYGLSLPAFAAIASEGDGYCDSLPAIGRDIYLTARTMATLRRALDRVDAPGLVVAAAHHDGEIVRLDAAI